MSLTIGTNCGFVKTAPTDDPGGNATSTIRQRAVVTRATSSSDTNRITQFGWWCNENSPEANFSIGIYSSNGEVVPGEAGTLLYSSTGHAKGTTLGWKTVDVKWDIEPNTDYWLGVQLNYYSGTNTTTDRQLTTGYGYDYIEPKTFLPNPYGGGALALENNMLAFYAVETYYDGWDRETKNTSSWTSKIKNNTSWTEVNKS